MNKTGIKYAIAYALFVIIVKLVIIFGGFAITDFGFKYSHIITVFLIIPFILMAIKHERDKVMGGYIRGREGMKIGITVVMISAIILSIYSYIEFQVWWEDFSKAYYSSEKFYQAYENFYKTHPNLKKETFEKVVELNLNSMSAFQFMTVRLITFVLIGIACSFLCGVMLRKRLPAA